MARGTTATRDEDEEEETLPDTAMIEVRNSTLRYTTQLCTQSFKSFRGPMWHTTLLCLSQLGSQVSLVIAAQRRNQSRIEAAIEDLQSTNPICCLDDCKTISYGITLVSDPYNIEPRIWNMSCNKIQGFPPGE